MRVALADDAALFRAGVASLLGRAGVTVTASVGDAMALRSAIAADRPDAVILDIRMPPTFTTEGLDAARLIRREHPDVGVLLLSQYVETRHVARLLTEGGAIGYLLKERVADAGELVDALHRVADGRSVIDPEVVTVLLGRARAPDPLAPLTVREREILALMAEGRSNHAIGARLALAPKTVETHVGHVLAKLDLPPVADDNRRVLAVLTYLQAVPEERL
ncbi:response regulator [Nitriliruptor alkaliphilus]|uniref:response regulator n=1 Tax=Nitriliruptor alkaliphilus TaxID=427918 RepID=UPI0006971D65|nr:response regulator transcription factor [Nitriliruptor alkaliphilus]